MPSNYPSDVEGIESRDTNTESGYVSGGSSDDYIPEIVFTKPHLQFLNRQLQFLEPQGMFPCSTPPAKTSSDVVGHRHPEMVHHITPAPLPDHCLRADWSRYTGHAVQAGGATPPDG